MDERGVRHHASDGRREDVITHGALGLEEVLLSMMETNSFQSVHEASTPHSATDQARGHWHVAIASEGHQPCCSGWLAAVTTETTLQGRAMVVVSCPLSLVVRARRSESEWLSLETVSRRPGSLLHLYNATTSE